MSSCPYLDIEKIKKEITIAHVLHFYGVRLNKISPVHLSGCCPIHHGDNPNAFHVDLEKNLFHCFTHCGGGSIFDFVMKKENLSFYSAALKIWNLFYPSHQRLPKKENIHLKLQTNHPYLRKRNIDEKWARYFHLGFCQYGIMKNRIAIPIFDPDNKIAAYCGRSIQDNISPKYFFPKGFNKSHYLFNIQHINSYSKKPVFVVEGFFDCIHIVKLGFDALAIMGSAISQQQLSLLKKMNRFYILMMDGDEAGRNASIMISKKMKLFNLAFQTVYLVHVKEPEFLDYHSLDCIACK
jgi:DNA primase